MSASIFEPLTLGEIQLANRIVMAPMTRSRAHDDDVPSELMVEYYSQRASAGLIITEGTQPSANGKGYCRTPGIYSDEHVAAWKKVVDAVHQKGGAIAMQVMHCGRIGHPDNKADGTENIAPSAVQADAEVFTETGMKKVPMPRALDLAEIPSIIDEYAQATANAMQAGFDGVELHCTSGYLPAQFLSTGTNQRTDAYGGSVRNRIRFVVETLEAMSDVAGAGRVGLRICPANPFNDLHDDDPAETFSELLKTLSPMGLAYLHAIRSPDPNIDVVQLAKQDFKGSLIINDGFDFLSSQQVIADGEAQAVSFGRAFIANPDLVERFQHDIALAEFDPNTLYTPGERGYTTYEKASR